MMRIFLIIILTFMLGMPKAFAIFAQESTQIMNNIELVINAERQLQSLLNQATMIENQIEELKSVATEPLQVWVQVDQQTAQLLSMIQEAIARSAAIENQLGQIKAQAQSIASAPSWPGLQIQIEGNTQNVVDEAIQKIDQSRQTYSQQQTALQALVTQSRSAVGQTQALQVLNQIQAQNAAQTLQMQEAINNLASMQAAQMTKDIQEKQAEQTQLNAELQPITNSTSSFDYGAN